MTCASCAIRVEKRLNRLDGVSASVNFATETARVPYPRSVALADLVRVVEATGYTAGVVREPAPLAPRLAVAVTATIPLLVLTMAFPGRLPWLAVGLALPVVTWAAWPFHRAALVNLRHGATTMDTLISLGVTVATGWSLVALVRGGDLYVEVGAVLTTFLLAGRYAEAGGGGAVGQGPGKGVGRRGTGGLRAGGSGDRRTHLRRLASRRGAGRSGGAGRGRRTDRRLPVRAGPGDPDRAARGYRSGSATRHPGTRSGSPGGHPPGGHHRARQDRDRDDRRVVGRTRIHRGTALRRRRRARGRTPDRPA